MGDPIGATQSFYSRGGGGGGGGGGGYKTQVGVRVLSGRGGGGNATLLRLGSCFTRSDFPLPVRFFFTRWKGGREVFRLDHRAGGRRCVRTQRLSEEGGGGSILNAVS